MTAQEPQDVVYAPYNMVTSVLMRLFAKAVLDFDKYPQLCCYSSSCDVIRRLYCICEMCNSNEVAKKPLPDDGENAAAAKENEGEQPQDQDNHHE